jgi:hypothetical protein
MVDLRKDGDKKNAFEWKIKSLAKRKYFFKGVNEFMYLSFQLSAIPIF